ncbi:isochorismate synthase [Oxynema sp. CENA135]|uniref:isochorismate synthase n=1 Tax=Oxynema sp. CENA135 TaxID=984206 RepID=UPI0019097781|nr:isochorismate synthase [Oxynema sp. CENA135]MBK4729919.1 isochorismate synthase [Oxynema sp. CENA135]
MPVVPSDANLLQDRRELYRFLATCQQVAVEKQCPQIASISLEVPPLDPLAILQALARPSRLYFYLENGGEQEAIAAIDSAVEFEVSRGKDRFDLVREFVRSSQKNTIATGLLDPPFSGLHFFCSFTFFDDPSSESSPFPAARAFLPRWQISRSQNRCFLAINTCLQSDDDLDRLSERVWQDYQNIIHIPSNGLRQFEPLHRLNGFKKFSIEQLRNFKESAIAAIDAIGDRQFHKIVLAHAIDVTLKTPFNLVHSLQNLSALYPDCYIFATGNGRGDRFIGASPERLLGIRNGQLVTDALAGSAPRGRTPREDEALAQALLNSEKERHEHRLVIDFITECLQQLGLNVANNRAIPLVPHLLQLSNIQHLWTPIRTEVPANVHPLEILARLHPTPAVAGSPQQTACEQIRHYECFDRGLYAAPLGWVDDRGNAEFIVGIRSAWIHGDTSFSFGEASRTESFREQRQSPAFNPSTNPDPGDRARLYAGAGIVAGSDPDKELAEIQLKLQALLKALL